MVVGTKPGTTVPLTLFRNNQPTSVNVTIEELDLDAEQGRSARQGESPNDQEPTPTGLGITLDPITPELARRMDLPPQ